MTAPQLRKAQEFASVVVNGIAYVQASDFKKIPGQHLPIEIPAVDPKDGGIIFAVPGGGRIHIDKLLKKRRVT